MLQALPVLCSLIWTLQKYLVRSTSYKAPHYTVLSNFLLIPPPQHLVLKHPQSVVFPYCERTSFTPIQNHRQNYGFVYFNFHVSVAHGKPKYSELNDKKAVPGFNLLVISWFVTLASRYRICLCVMIFLAFWRRDIIMRLVLSAFWAPWYWKFIFTLRTKSNIFKAKLSVVLKKLSTVPWRGIGEWMYKYTSWPRH
jgi:hypothetical protein